MLSGVVVAVGALAVLVLAAPPGPSSVVAIGEPSTYTGQQSVTDGAQPAFPGCPSTVEARGAVVDTSARRTAARFAEAWTTGNARALIHLSDPTFARRASDLQLGGSLGRRPRIAVSGLGSGAVADRIVERCGPAALDAVRIATVRARRPGAAPVHVYLVWRGGPSRVWAVR